MARPLRLSELRIYSGLELYNLTVAARQELLLKSDIIINDAIVQVFTCDRKEIHMLEHYREFKIVPGPHLRSAIEMSADFDQDKRVYLTIHIDEKCKHFEDKYIIQSKSTNPNIFNSIYYLRKNMRFVNALGEELHGVTGGEPLMRLRDMIMLDPAPRQEQRLKEQEKAWFDKWKDCLVERPIKPVKT